MTCPDCSIIGQTIHGVRQNMQIVYCDRHTPARVAALEAALHVCYAWILLGNHDEAPGWIEARDKAHAALTLPRTP